MKKIVSIIIIFILTINLNLVSYADDAEEENINEEEISNIINTSIEAENIPKQIQEHV